MICWFILLKMQWLTPGLVKLQRLKSGFWSKKQSFQTEEMFYLQMKQWSRIIHLQTEDSSPAHSQIHQVWYIHRCMHACMHCTSIHCMHVRRHAYLYTDVVTLWHSMVHCSASQFTHLGLALFGRVSLKNWVTWCHVRIHKLAVIQTVTTCSNQPANHPTTLSLNSITQLLFLHLSSHILSSFHKETDLRLTCDFCCLPAWECCGSWPT